MSDLNAGVDASDRDPTTFADPDSVSDGGTKLRGRVALVTGGTRGIGAAIARSLARQGAAMAVGYGSGHERAAEFKESFEKEFPDSPFSLHSGNIGVGDDCQRVIAEVLERHGRLDILVNNAGITIDRTVAKMTHDDWDKVISVNLSGAFYLSQAALDHMIERGSGRIIMVSSVIGETGNIGQANYAASKSALFGLTKTLAKEATFQLARAGKLGPDSIGVTVNCVTPGFIVTEMTDSVPDKILDRITATIPTGRLGRAEEVARVVHVLAADASSYITGQTWGVNGGLDM